jgi:hypothetical protein
MKNNEFWNAIIENDSSSWIKLPRWSIAFFRKFGISDTDLSVLLFLVFSITDSLQEINAPTRTGLRFCGINERAYYRSIDKLKKLGLRKIGNGFYDILGFIETVKYGVDND